MNKAFSSLIKSTKRQASEKGINGNCNIVIDPNFINSKTIHFLFAFVEFIYRDSVYKVKLRCETKLVNIHLKHSVVSRGDILKFRFFVRENYSNLFY